MKRLELILSKPNTFFILIFLLYPLSFSTEEVFSQPSWLAPGKYAIYKTYSSIHYVSGIFSKVDNCTYGWRILSIKDNNITIRVFIKYYWENKSHLSEKIVFVDAKSREVFNEKGRFIGIWPFWLNPWEIGKSNVIFSRKMTENRVIKLIIRQREMHWTGPLPCGKYIYTLDWYGTDPLIVYGINILGGFNLFYDHATGLLIMNTFGDDILISLFGIVTFIFNKNVDPRNFLKISLLDTNVVELKPEPGIDWRPIIISLILLFGWASIKYVLGWRENVSI